MIETGSSSVLHLPHFHLTVVDIPRITEDDVKLTTHKAGCLIAGDIFLDHYLELLRPPQRILVIIPSDTRP